MFPVNPYDVKRTTDVRAEEAVRRMHHQHLLREAARGHGVSVPRQIALLLRNSGSLLVAAGRRLQQIGLPQKAPIEPQAPSRALLES